MADENDTSDKTEDPTQKRLDDAHDRGDVAKSQEVNTWFMIAGATLVLSSFSGSIGSGMVEGSCKTVVGRRLKQTGARWRVRRVERMASLCCLAYGNQWDAYWKKATA